MLIPLASSLKAFGLKGDVKITFYHSSYNFLTTSQQVFNEHDEIFLIEKIYHKKKYNAVIQSQPSLLHSQQIYLERSLFPEGVYPCDYFDLIFEDNYILDSFYTNTADQDIFVLYKDNTKLELPFLPVFFQQTGDFTYKVLEPSFL
jgi:hypothetical protein